MLSRVVLAIAFIIIWILVILPITPQLFDTIMNHIDQSNVPLELQFELKTPKLVYDNATNTTTTVWESQPYIIDFKPAIGILLLLVFYIAPPYTAIKILLKRRW